MRAIRIFAGTDGASQFEDLDVPLADVAAGLRASERLPALGVVFIEDNGKDELHRGTAPQRQFVLVLQGALEVEVSDGSSRRIGPGDVVLAEDTTGRGHITRGVETPRRAVFIAVPDELDVSGWRQRAVEATGA